MFIDSPPSSADFIVIGGGTAGLALASRLSQNPKTSSLSVLVIEAGQDEASNPLSATPIGALKANHSELDYEYWSVPQPQLNNRRLHLAGGKALSGATATNYGFWTRGPKNDYDRWAELTGEPGWSYDGLLPYFKSLESHFDEDGDRDQHGFEGPIKTCSVSKSDPTRRYPLREPLKNAMLELGLDLVPDYNDGFPAGKGIGEGVETWKDGKRQAAQHVMDLSNVKVLCGTYVDHVVVVEDDDGKGGKRATGIQLAGGALITANREVIVSAGAYRTPQILMLSGIGPAAELEKLDIPIVIDNSQVGRNYFDQFTLPVWLKVRHPENGVAIGSPLFNKPGYAKGFPADFMSWEITPSSLLRPAVEKDAKKEQEATSSSSSSNFDPYALLAPNRIHNETVFLYLPATKPGNLPIDGSLITAATLCMQNTSRGSLTIPSRDPTSYPLVDPNFYTTASDRATLRYGIRRLFELLETPSGKSIFLGEMLPKGCSTPLSATSTDAEIDERVKSEGYVWSQAAGTAAMDTSLARGVVDSQCRVHGVQGLRVVDASVLPAPIAAHLVVCIYALAWRIGDIIAQETV